MYRHKKGFFMLAIILVIGLLAGCSSANDAGTFSKGAIANEKAAWNEGNVAGNTSYGESEDAKADTLSANSGTAGTDSAVGGGFDYGTAANTEGLNQKIIYKATLSMQVNELASAASTLRNAIHQSGGYILQFQDTRHDGEIGASYSIKVPAAGFMSFIDRIEQIEHNDFERNIGGKDVSEEYVDLESRLKARKLVEERLLAMMVKAVKADDLLKFSQQLSEVQEDIERIKGRIRYLDNNVSFSTVELRLYQTGQSLKQVNAETPHLSGRMSEALVGSTKVIWDGLKLLLVILAGALPVAAVLVIIAIPALWLLHHKKRKAEESQPHSDEEQQQPPV